MTAKKKKNGDNNGHGTCCKVIVPWLEVHHQFSKIAGKKYNKAIINM